jgi:hypothetical protein
MCAINSSDQAFMDRLYNSDLRIHLGGGRSMDSALSAACRHG